MIMISVIIISEEYIIIIIIRIIAGKFLYQILISLFILNHSFFFFLLDILAFYIIPVIVELFWILTHGCNSKRNSANAEQKSRKGKQFSLIISTDHRIPGWINSRYKRTRCNYSASSDENRKRTRRNFTEISLFSFFFFLFFFFSVCRRRGMRAG